MPTLSEEKRLRVLAGLVNGNSIRAVSRMTDVHQDTIGRFAVQLGVGCQRLHDRMVRDLVCPFVDMDEQYSWCGKRQVNVDPAKDGPDVGEQWTWAAECRTSNLTISWHVGKRNAESAYALVADTRSRLAVMPQITTDGLALYEQPILLQFGYAVPYAKMIKRFANSGGRPGVAEKYAVPKGTELIERRAVFGSPDMGKVTTYAIERSNLTNRQWNARLHRRTLAFSKKVENHRASIALAYVYRNLCHIPRDMRQTPAMAANVSEHVWSLEELMHVALSEPEATKPTATPLVIPQPATTARELPNGRGWLRVVSSDGGAAAPSPKPVPPPTPPVAASAPVEAAPASTSPAADATGQLDLFSWRPAQPGEQLSLFGDD